jgi:hypothetical protein
MTKIFSITCSKNESDIIETFVRVNSRIVDFFIFIDDSTDNTKSILNKLKDEGFSILVFDTDIRTKYDQSIFMTSGLMEALKLGSQGDFYIPLDCDEFLTSENKENYLFELNKIPVNNLGYQFWATYIPISQDFHKETESALFKCFKQKKNKDSRFGKIIIPHYLGNQIIINVGSHDARFISGGNVMLYAISLTLGHFPIRSAHQVIRKSIVALDGLIRKKNRVQGEGFHVYKGMRKIIENNFDISLSELQEMAYKYATQDQNDVMEFGEPPRWAQHYNLKYHDIVSADETRYLSEIILGMWKEPLHDLQLLELRANLSI